MDNIKRYNIFIFLGTFSRNLIEVFIPIILYNKGISIQYIFFFLLINYSFSFLLNFPLAYISKIITFRWLIILSSISVAISYYYLFLFPITLPILVLITFTHVINAHTYWLSRHYYALKVLPHNSIGPQIGNIVIFSQAAIIPASYIGALLISNLNIEYVLTIVILMYLVTIIPLYKIRTTRDDITLYNGIEDIFKTIPRRSLYFFILAQFRFISKYLFPLYIFIYVRSTYEFIGIFNAMIGIASMVFVYIFARKMDKNKDDYLVLSGLISTIVWLLKLNVFLPIYMLIIGFIEGLVEKMYETSFNRNMYALGKQYNGISYSALVEGLQQLSRVLIMIIVIVFIKDIRVFLYISALMLTVTGFIGFDDGDGGY
jgi:hypothetical protein